MATRRSTVVIGRVAFLRLEHKSSVGSTVLLGPLHVLDAPPIIGEPAAPMFAMEDSSDPVALEDIATMECQGMESVCVHTDMLVHTANITGRPPVMGMGFRWTLVLVGVSLVSLARIALSVPLIIMAVLLIVV